MKRLFFSASVSCLALLVLNACNNGKYDAKPGTDLSIYVNPSSPKGGINTAFNWGGSAPMSCEISGNFWKADNATFNQVNLNGQNFIELVGNKDAANPKNAIHLYFKESDMTNGAELTLDWSNDMNGYCGQYYSDVDSVYHGVVERGQYLFLSGVGGPHGSAKIVTYDGQHLKGMFYMIPRNTLGFYINFQKGYFDITK